MQYLKYIEIIFHRLNSFAFFLQVKLILLFGDKIVFLFLLKVIISYLGGSYRSVIDIGYLKKISKHNLFIKYDKFFKSLSQKTSL